MITSRIIDQDKVFEKIGKFEYIFKKGNKIAEYGIHQASKVLVTNIKQGVKKTNYKTGGLYRSVGIKKKKKYLGEYVGFRYPLGASAHLVDRGTKMRHNGIRSTGRVKGSDFYEQALRQSTPQVTDILYTTIDQCIINLIK